MSTLARMDTYCMSADEIDRRFDLHSPDQATGELMDSVRKRFKRLAGEISTELPQCRESSLAFTKLDEALFHAISALARENR